MDVHLNHAGIGRDLDHSKTRIVWRRISFDENRHLDANGGIFNSRNEVNVVFRRTDRRQKYAKASLARFHGYSSAHNAAAGESSGLSCICVQSMLMPRR